MPAAPDPRTVRASSAYATPSSLYSHPADAVPTLRAGPPEGSLGYGEAGQKARPMPGLRAPGDPHTFEFCAQKALGRIKGSAGCSDRSGNHSSLKGPSSVINRWTNHKYMLYTRSCFWLVQRLSNGSACFGPKKRWTNKNRCPTVCPTVPDFADTHDYVGLAVVQRFVQRFVQRVHPGTWFRLNGAGPNRSTALAGQPVGIACASRHHPCVAGPSPVV